MAYAYQYTGEHGVYTVDGLRYIGKGDRVASLDEVEPGRYYRFVRIEIPDPAPSVEPEPVTEPLFADQEPEVSDD